MGTNEEKDKNDETVERVTHTHTHTHTHGNSKRLKILQITTKLVIIGILVLAIFALGKFAIRENIVVVEEAQEEVDPKAEVTHQATAPSGYTEIIDAEGLRSMSSNLSGNYILMKDIDMTDEEWTLSSTTFSGILDGNNYTISNINIESNYTYVGMFGYINSGTVKNLIIDNISVTSTNNKYIGALAGYIKESNITNVQIKDTKIIGKGIIGGLVGYNDSSTMDNIQTTGLTDIMATVSITNIGGIIGFLKRWNNK